MGVLRKPSSVFRRDWVMRVLRKPSSVFRERLGDEGAEKTQFSI